MLSIEWFASGFVVFVVGGGYKGMPEEYLLCRVHKTVQCVEVVCGKRKNNRALKSKTVLRNSRRARAFHNLTYWETPPSFMVLGGR